MSSTRKKKRDRRAQGWVLLVLLLVAAAAIALRVLGQPEPAPPAETAEPIQAAPAPAPSPESIPRPTETPAPQVTPQPTEAPTEATPEPTSEPVLFSVYPDEREGYTEYTYGLVNDMVYTYQYQRAEGIEAARALVGQLKEANPALGMLWENIMEYWFFTNEELEVNPGILPDGLPEDDSLCIVVLGFQLESDGSMAPELLGRCQVALECAQKYPKAFVAVTGGGTAAINTSATEAGVMAKWFLNQGLDENRLLVEDASMTTDQNAEFTCQILEEQAPQVTSLAIVSSDYHIPLGSLMFQEMAMLREYESGAAPYRVVSNAAYETKGDDFFNDPRNQAPYVWFLAGPSYGK